MEYVGEFLVPGRIGHFLAILSFVASLVATVAFYKAIRPESFDTGKSWLKIARTAFALETIAVIGMFGVLYYIISSHLFEYKYAWQHSSRSLQVEYLLSCFWEGQEGSFMLWAFWHCVLGWILIAKSGRWEAPVMMVMSFTQTMLATMLLGLYIAGSKVGSSPFVLLRNEMDAPIFSRPDYLEFVKDGNGLNALLQNYWMVIHPPVLFLGFAATIVPFAFALAGLITRDHKGWTTPALPWASFAAAALGTGIMMGAAWAYESLTFGGYWAWDPVENASLVPWLILISGLHTNLIFKHSGYSLKSTYVFYVLAFLFILYSTFLTRSGVLGDTSVHSFTDLGMNGQLFLFLNTFIWIGPFAAAKNNLQKGLVAAAFAVPMALSFFSPIFTFVSAIGGIVWFAVVINKDKEIPHIAREEQVYSREFWMFIASLLFCLSGLVIIAKTSVPVFNKVFGTEIAPPADVEFSHNNIQIWVAVMLGALTAVTQFFKYRNTDKGQLLKALLPATAIAVVLTLIVALTEGIKYDKQGVGFQAALYLGLFSAIYAVVGNAAYIFQGLKGKLKLAAGSVSHIGFGLVLLGILLSSGNRSVLSYNTTGISPLKADDKENSRENTTLIKGQATDMGDYMVTYTRDTLNPHDRKRYFEIDFARKDGKEQFKLYPDVIENNKGGEGLTPNPDARHYLTRDIFTYVTFLSDPEARKKDTTGFRTSKTQPGDTLFYGNGMWVVNEIKANPGGKKFEAYRNDTILAADITVISKDGRLYNAQPAFLIKGFALQQLPDTVMSQSLVFNLEKFTPETMEIQVGVKESNAILDFLTLKVYEFPWINVLWLGIVVMMIGFAMAIVRRIQLMQRSKSVE